MSIDTQTAITLVGAAVSVGTSLGVVKANLARLKEKQEDTDAKITFFHSWKGTHDVLTAESNLNQERRFGEFAAASARRDAQYQAILDRLDKIDRKLEGERRNGEDRREG